MVITADRAFTPFNLSAASWPGYQLTTIRQPMEKMTQEAVNILIEKMKNPEHKAQTCLLPGQLNLRESVRKS